MAVAVMGRRILTWRLFVHQERREWRRPRTETPVTGFAAAQLVDCISAQYLFRCHSEIVHTRQMSPPTDHACSSAATRSCRVAACCPLASSGSTRTCLHSEYVCRFLNVLALLTCMKASDTRECRSEIESLAPPAPQPFVLRGRPAEPWQGSQFRKALEHLTHFSSTSHCHCHSPSISAPLTTWPTVSMLQNNTAKKALQCLPRARRFSSTPAPAAISPYRQQAPSKQQTQSKRNVSDTAKRSAPAAQQAQTAQRTVPSPAFNRTDEARQKDVQPLQPFRQPEMDHSFVGMTGGEIFHEMMLRQGVEHVCTYKHGLAYVSHEHS